MGLRNRSLIKEPTVFFVTTSTYEHRVIFNNDSRLTIAVDCLLRIASEMKIRLVAYVVMSTHMHLFGFFEGGGAQLSGFISSIKGRIRKDIVGNKSMWEHRFDDKVITTEEMMFNAIEYIHNNPVKSGVVDEATDYRYSSARIWVELNRMIGFVLICRNCQPRRADSGK